MRRNVVYRYDGTFEGLLCCVFESVARKEMPADVVTMEDEQMQLMPVKEIATDAVKAARVFRSIPKKMSPAALSFVEHAFLTCLPNKEVLLLDFFHQGYRYGAQVLNRLTDDTVHALVEGVKHLDHEAHLFTGFVRFSVIQGVLVSKIAPKNVVLPLMKPHFIDRYPNEAFLIHDAVHGMALVYRPYQSAIIPMDDFVMAEPDEEERTYRRLWKLFYDTIAVEGRENPRCRMTHMPKRYWDYLTEFQEVASCKLQVATSEKRKTGSQWRG